MFLEDLISCGGPPVILPYKPSGEGEMVVEHWKTKIKFFTRTIDSFCPLQTIEASINEFLKDENKVFCDIKFNSNIESHIEKIVVLLIYKEKVNEDEKKHN